MTQRITIAQGWLRLEAAVVAEERMPAAIGWHLWFRSDGEDLRVELLADSVLDLAPDLTPTGALRQVDDRTDLRARPKMSGRRLDDVYALVESPAVVEWPDIELTLAFAAPVRSAVVCRHPEAVCVEPSTAWPDSIRLSETGRSDTGLVILNAGDRLLASTTWTWVARQPTAAGSQIEVSEGQGRPTACSFGNGNVVRHTYVYPCPSGTCPRQDLLVAKWARSRVVLETAQSLLWVPEE